MNNFQVNLFYQLLTTNQSDLAFVSAIPWPYQTVFNVFNSIQCRSDPCCLLAVLFIVPYLARHGNLSPLTLAITIFIYVGVVVPLMTGILPRKTLFTFARKFLEITHWKFIFEQVKFLLGWAHRVFFGIHVTVMQVVFNMAAEKVLCPDQRLCSLYVLLFYSVLAYLQRALQSRPWVQLLNESSTTEFLKLTTAFIIVRLGKGVVMSLVLLTFTLQFNQMEPSFTFVFVTFIYFCLTQYQSHLLTTTVLTQWLRKLNLYCLEGLEEYWAPIIISSLTVGFAVTMDAICLFSTNSYILVTILSYTNIFTPFEIYLKGQWNALQHERLTISRFPLASWKNPIIQSGGLCAICLDKLGLLSARVTSCGHVFHGNCLRICLRYSTRCPLCKLSI